MNRHARIVLALAALAAAIASAAPVLADNNAVGSGATKSVAAGADAASDAAAGGEETDAAELAKKLANPIASLTSVPFQYNRDTSSAATTETLIIQPVIPFSIGTDWNLITRTIMPLVSYQSSRTNQASNGGEVAEGVDPTGGKTASGLGDVLQSFFLSPKALTSGGWIWGLGPAFLWPTASEPILGKGKWGAGPTLIVLKQENGFTYGLLMNQIWSYGGWGPNAVSALFAQPIFSYTTKASTTVGFTSESTYDWERHQWTVPLIVTASQLLKLGPQIIAVQLGAKYFIEQPAGGPDWGLRFGITLLFPK
jgi:hypothetical protein